jgi:hypothetical protein
MSFWQVVDLIVECIGYLVTLGVLGGIFAAVYYYVKTRLPWFPFGWRCWFLHGEFHELEEEHIDKPFGMGGYYDCWWLRCSKCGKRLRKMANGETAPKPCVKCGKPVILGDYSVFVNNEGKASHDDCAKA